MLRLPILAIVGCVLAVAVATWFIGSSRTNDHASLTWGKVRCAGGHALKGNAAVISVPQGARCRTRLTIENTNSIGGQVVSLTFRGAGSQGRGGLRVVQQSAAPTVGADGGPDATVAIGKSLPADGSLTQPVVFQVAGCAAGPRVTLKDWVSATIRTWHRTGTSAGITSPVTLQVRGC